MLPYRGYWAYAIRSAASGLFAIGHYVCVSPDMVAFPGQDRENGYIVRPKWKAACCRIVEHPTAAQAFRHQFAAPDQHTSQYTAENTTQQVPADSRSTRILSAKERNSATLN